MVYPFLHLMGAQVWCALLIVGFIGYGLLAVKHGAGVASSIGLQASVGMALAVAFGGILNLLQLVTARVLVGLTLVGVFLAIGHLLRRKREAPPLEMGAILSAWRDGSRWARLAFICFVLLFLFRTVSSTRAYQYLREDDENFYLAMPVKMMQTHHYAPDPYSERRIESSIGGSYFLQCLILSALPLQNVQMADRGIGAVLIVLLVLALSRKGELSAWETIILAGFSVVLTPVDFNVTFSVLPTACLLAMVLLALSREDFNSRPAVLPFLIGIMGGALCVLKSTSLPFAAIFCLILCARMEKGAAWIAALKGWAAALLGALVVMAPWMIAMRMTSGTFLYPLFGSGYDFSAYHQFPVPFRADPLKVFLKGAPFIVFLSVAIFGQLFLLRRARSTVLLVTTAACLISSVATAFATGADDSERYNFPIVVPALLLIFLQFSQEIRLRPGWIAGHLLRGSAAALMLTWIGVHASRGQYWVMGKEVEMCFSGPDMMPPETRLEYARIRAAFPSDGLVLATLQSPFLLDPLDERILLADFPGCAGLPPGWPIHQDGEALADYLLGHSIRYLAYTYAGNTQLAYCQKTDLTRMSVRSQIQYGGYLLANQQYLELKRTRKSIYDDGTVFILDLSAKVATHS